MTRHAHHPDEDSERVTTRQFIAEVAVLLLGIVALLAVVFLTAGAYEVPS